MKKLNFAEYFCPYTLVIRIRCFYSKKERDEFIEKTPASNVIRADCRRLKVLRMDLKKEWSNHSTFSKRLLARDNGINSCADYVHVEIVKLFERGPGHEEVF